MNFLYWAAFGLLVLGLVLIAYGAKRGLSLTRVGVVVSATGSLALTVYYGHEGPVFLAVFFGALFGADVVTLIWSLNDRRRQVAAK